MARLLFVGGFMVSLPQDVLRELKKAPERISPAFVQIKDYIESSYGNKSEEYRRLIFAIVYSNYSAKKKMQIHYLQKNSKKEEDLTDAIDRIHNQFCNEYQYKELCASAERLIEKIKYEISLEIIQSITGVFVSELNTKIEEIKPKHGFWQFVKSSALHAFEIFLAAIILWIAYEGLTLVMPFLEEVSRKYLGDLDGLLNGSEVKPPASTPPPLR